MRKVYVSFIFAWISVLYAVWALSCGAVRNCTIYYCILSIVCQILPINVANVILNVLYIIWPVLHVVFLLGIVLAQCNCGRTHVPNKCTPCTTLAHDLHCASHYQFIVCHIVIQSVVCFPYNLCLWSLLKTFASCNVKM